MIYHISGSGDPVVFLHGIYLGASSYEWSKVYPHFTFGREVIVPDLIGFGESERPGNDGCHRLFRKPGRILRNTCGDRTPIVVASGLTAGIALLMASRHPERVSRLILLLPTGLKESGKWGAAGMVTLVGRRAEPFCLSKLSFPRPVYQRMANKVCQETPRASMKKWCGH